MDDGGGGSGVAITTFFGVDRSMTCEDDASDNDSVELMIIEV